jgi:hypothetical protein
MLTHLVGKQIVQPALVALVLGAGAVTLVPSLALTASDTSTYAAADSTAASEQPAVRSVAERFLHAMAQADEETVWMFASEEEQDAFGTEAAAYDAYADAFPALTQARDVAFEKTWQDGEVPFVEVALMTGSKPTHRATMGFWLDDAGDWELVSCDVKPVGDLVAGL